MIGRSLTSFALATFAVAFATPAFALPTLSEPAQQVLRLLHVFAAIVFMGNLIVTAMWMTNAKRTRDTNVLHYASRMVVRADWLFMLPGVVLLVASGVLTMGAHGGFGKAAWAELALTLIILSGIIWIAALIPLQRRMVQITREAVELKLGLADRFYMLHRRWTVWGGIATLLPAIALYLMVYKPLLWGGE